MFNILCSCAIYFVIGYSIVAFCIASDANSDSFFLSIYVGIYLFHSDCYLSRCRSHDARNQLIIFHLLHSFRFVSSILGFKLCSFFFLAKNSFH